MINFPCRCGQPLEAVDDQAGLTTQCPKCGLLVDIPNVSELSSLETDGSYKVGEPQVQPNPAALPEMQRIFTRGKRDEFGNEIDLRGPAQGGNTGIYGTLGPDPDAFKPPPEQPKYDPETGELIVPLGVAPSDEPPPAQKLPLAMAVTNPAAEQAVSRRGKVSIIAEEPPRGFEIILSLFHPINLLVILLYAFALSFALAVLVLVAGFFLAAAAFGGPVPASGMRTLVPLLALFLLVLLGSHIANVIEETGPGDKDELPRPLRDASVYDDIINPAYRVAIAGLLAYGPAFAWRVFSESQVGVSLSQELLTFGRWGFYVLGTFVFPALLLTICTSASYANLRPDRVLGVIGRSGGGYWLALLLWTLVTLLPTGTTWVVGRVPTLLAWPILLCTLPLAASFLLHGFGWLLGMAYRDHQPEYPWVLQRHVPTVKRAFQIIAKPRSPRPAPPPPPRDVR